MKNMLAGILLVVTLLYVFCPIDLMPGLPFDDIIVGLLGFGSALKMQAA